METTRLRAKSISPVIERKFSHTPLLRYFTDKRFKQISHPRVLYLDGLVHTSREWLNWLLIGRSANVTTQRCIAVKKQLRAHCAAINRVWLSTTHMSSTVHNCHQPCRSNVNHKQLSIMHSCHQPCRSNVNHNQLSIMHSCHQPYTAEIKHTQLSSTILSYHQPYTADINHTQLSSTILS